jgi:hypothetical protein
MECIICQDIGSEPLQENTSCSCKYKCHSSCWIDYVHSKTKINCPLCRKDLTIKSQKPTNLTPLIQPSVPIIPTAPPYAPPPHRTQSTFQQISYQEFIDIIQQDNSTQNTVIEVRPSIQPQPQPNPKDLPTSQKIAKVVIGLSILALIITLVVVFMKLL